jgi:hypothetical protein
MPATFLALSALAVIFFLLWALRGNFPNSSALKGSRRLHTIDTAAFRNLLSKEDDRWLQASLSSSDYRKTRRARLRAIQEYLIRIAEDCAAIMAMVRVPNVNASSQLAETVIQRAIRIRLICLGFWLLLWAEWLFPGLEISPVRILRTYEEFRSKAEASLSQSNQEGSLA